MGLQQSKDESLYMQVSYGNIEGVKKLHRDGAGLEWLDREARTPLIVACMDAQLLNVATTLIELGANVNAFRPGRYAGSPLHHAAKKGLSQTVKLLLSHGANPLLMNDDCQTPLDVAREHMRLNVVREIERHLCLFSGWLREFHGPGFLGSLAPQLVSKKVWVVVLPCGARTPTKPFKLELAIYSNLQESRPHSITPLWKANMEEPKFDHSVPVVIIVDSAARIKLAPLNENEKTQLQMFCNACKGVPQGPCPAFLQSTVPLFTIPSSSETLATPPPFPSAPPLEATISGPTHYPSIDSDYAPVTLSAPDCGSSNDGRKGEGDESSACCAICLDARVEGACIPCGHMAGCMACLNEIKGKEWGCPVCRSKIDQIIRVYSVS